jgi:hypothetical protein
MTKLLEDVSVDRVTIRSIPKPRDKVRTRFAAIPCAYCWEPIPAASFVYWSQAKRLLSAPCPCCDRRMTVATRTWKTWSART